MALVTTKEMFAKAIHGGYAVGAFNVNDMEIVQGIVEAAKEEKSPVILQVSAGARKYAKPVYLRKLVEAAVEDTGIDVVLHLDHGANFDICRQCVDDGFTSVMYDGSSLTFEENVKNTQKVVEYAHEKGVVVEAELGTLAGVEDDVIVDNRDVIYTNPEQAAEFVKRTGVDSLAIAIGTSHGAYKFHGEPKLDYERLQKISDLIPDTPLVLHGASTVMPDYVDMCNQYGAEIPGAKGVPEDLLRKAAEYTICKINIDTDLRLAMTAEIRRYFMDHPEEFDPRKYLGAARAGIKKMVQHKMKNVLKSSGTLL